MKKKIGLFFWPKGGNVEKAANKIKQYFNEDEIDLIDLSVVQPKHLFYYENLILGSSTVGAEHWEDATEDNKWYQLFHQMDIDNVDFFGKKVALFGLGDQINYPHNFVDGMERVYSNIKNHNITLVGQWANEGYEFSDSLALHNGQFRGLALDLDNDDDDITNKRIEKWVKLLKTTF